MQQSLKKATFYFFAHTLTDTQTHTQTHTQSSVLTQTGIQFDRVIMTSHSEGAEGLKGESYWSHTGGNLSMSKHSGLTATQSSLSAMFKLFRSAQKTHLCSLQRRSSQLGWRLGDGLEGSESKIRSPDIVLQELLCAFIVLVNKSSKFFCAFQTCYKSQLNNTSVLWFDNGLVKVWSGLGTKTWTGLERDHDLG